MSDAINKTPLQKVVIQFEKNIKGKWKPNTKFYKRVNINQKRFGMLRRGELEMSLSEAKNLADFFKVPINTFIN